MQITVRLHGGWGSSLPGGRATAQLSVSAGARVTDVMWQLKMDDPNILMSINGNLVDATCELHEGDRLDFIHAVEGG